MNFTRLGLTWQATTKLGTALIVLRPQLVTCTLICDHCQTTKYFTGLSEAMAFAIKELN